MSKTTSNVKFGSDSKMSHSTITDKKSTETQSFASFRSFFTAFSWILNIRISIFNSSAGISL